MWQTCQEVAFVCLWFCRRKSRKKCQKLKESFQKPFRFWQKTQGFEKKPQGYEALLGLLGFQKVHKKQTWSKCTRIWFWWAQKIPALFPWKGESTYQIFWQTGGARTTPATLAVSSWWRNSCQTESWRSFASMSTKGTRQLNLPSDSLSFSSRCEINLFQFHSSVN